ncbi:MAG: hypothetical protein KIT11_05955 [Fimbriimonadaceae bacterium]|nr:hypothetical protein [Fimbriimonadaceae bacterium]QYK55901.1 MAG: hypothetical protein KF733_00145 [Fimbriimonadaceae bacterium]
MVKAEKRGPGWQEWLLSLSCTLLIGYEQLVRREMETPQTAERYYSLEAGVTTLHFLGQAVALACTAATLLWIILANKRVFQTTIFALAGIGIILCWIEVLRAIGTQPNSVYILTELPYRPLNNMGIVGAQVFGTYLILRGRDLPGPVWRSLLTKMGLAACLFLFQLIAWELLSRRMG